MSWDNSEVYTTIEINGDPIDGDATTFEDSDVSSGENYTYSIVGINGSGSSAPVMCWISIPEECPPCDSCCLPSQILATGQTKCYDGGGVTACDQPDFPGQDGYYRFGCSMGDRFVDNKDGTVTDTCTGFMWQQSTADINKDGGITEEDVLPWQIALQYCDELLLCNDGTWTTNKSEAANHDGIKYDDWRLPNVRELLSIVDYGRCYPALQPVFSTILGDFWTSTTGVNKENGAWLVGGRMGGSHTYDKLVGHYIRAVRS